MATRPLAADHRFSPHSGPGLNGSLGPLRVFALPKRWCRL